MLEKVSNTFSYKLLIVISNFLIVSLTSRVLGSEGRGETNLFLTDFSIIYLFSGIIAGTTISFFISKKDLYTMCVLGYSWSILICILGAPILGVIHPTNYSFWLFGISLIQSFTMVNQMILLGKNDLKAYNLNTAIQPVAYLAFIFGSHFLGYSLTIDFFIQSFFYSSLFAFVASFIPAKKHIYLYEMIESWQTFKELIRYGFKSNYDNILETLNYRAGIYFLFWFGFTNAVGELSNSIALAEGTWIISNSLALVLYAHSLQSDDLREQQKLTLTYAKICFLGTSVALFVLISIPDSIYVFLFGNNFQDLVLYISILAPGVAFLATSNVIGHFLAAKGDYKANNLRSTLGFVLVVVLLFLLIPILGKKGAAIATSLSYFISSLYLIFYFFRNSSVTLIDLRNTSDLSNIWKSKKNPGFPQK
jgi:O-antigen/teichoic acid export membrane protein